MTYYFYVELAKFILGFSFLCLFVDTAVYAAYNILLKMFHSNQTVIGRDLRIHMDLYRSRYWAYANASFTLAYIMLSQ